MPHPRFTGDEIAKRGEAIYNDRVRARVETAEHVGMIVSVDIETGDFAIGLDPLDTSRQLLARHPDAATWTRRIGYDAVYAFGSAMLRTEP